MSMMTADSAPSSETAAAREERRVSLFTLCILALGVGIFTGVGAVALRSLIGLIHNVMFNGVFQIAYNANILEGPSRFGNWVILSPILGGLVVVFLVERFAPEAKGHGVPEVMDAIYYTRGKIRGVVAVIKSLASALSIGSGASVGREGPIIQTILDKGMTATGLLILLFALKLLATTISLGCGASGGIFSPSLFLGSTLGAAFASLAIHILPNAGMTLPSAAIVGMAALVGAGAGGVMTGIIMVFEMTRDYAIIVPVTVAVAVAAGVRRALILAAAGSTLRECVGWEDIDDLRAMIVEREGRIVGLIPPRSGLWRESVNNPGRLVDDFVEKRPVICRDVDLVSLVLAPLKRRRSGAAIVFTGAHRPHAADIVGVITKRAIADAVIDDTAD